MLIKLTDSYSVIKKEAQRKGYEAWEESEKKTAILSTETHPVKEMKN